MGFTSSFNLIANPHLSYISQPSKSFFESYQIFTEINSAAYKVSLLDDEKIHNVFHVSKLKHCVRTEFDPASLDIAPSEFVDQQLMVSRAAL
ncbi:unnamed protein product [Cuscuta campestris]|uniref:Tf2-1-like SH3-like domain-containing protein n=1 Tax=Cuscuta campestris TaxID=132261 RepID=A0A484N591_9ASTE|nr:unnamed protein product [Cuscuta campestris]